MLSRVVETIYWMARYIERAENIARLINVNSNLLMDLPRGIAPGWLPLLAIVGTDPDSPEIERDNERAVIRYLIADTRNSSSIVSSLSQARENARTIRDSIPREAWEQINGLHLYAQDNLSLGTSKRGRFKYLKEIIARSQLLTGLLAGTMSHDDGYIFLRVGRNIERADMTTRIIDVRSANLLTDDVGEMRPFNNIQWMSVLKSLTGYQMYRRELQVRVRRAGVLRFLLQSQTFPRAVYHCVCAVEQSVQHLPNNDEVLRALARLKRTIQEADVSGLEQDSLHEFLDELQIGLAEIHSALGNAYFLTQQLVKEQ